MKGLRRMATRDALREARAVGLTLREVGPDVIVTFPGVRSVRVPVPSRQKDAPCALVKLIERRRHAP